MKLSIITNFGCKYQCNYCIWKNTKFLTDKYDQKFHRFWENKNWLKAFYKFATPTISISGGGDPMFDYERNLDFWKFLDKHDFEYDIHTSDPMIFLLHPQFKHLKKIVYHLKNVESIPVNITHCTHKNIRITVVADFVAKNESYLNEIEQKFPVNWEFSYRQLYEKDQPYRDLSLFKNVIKRRKNSKFIENGDYNLYLFPDALITNKFLYHV
jgi:organic radical activating enzyme